MDSFFHCEKNSFVDKPLEEIYRELDLQTWENDVFSVFVLLPPLRYENLFVKGILLTSGINTLLQEFPAIPELFHTVVSSAWCSYPSNPDVDGLQTLYANPQREEWFRKTFPERAHQALIPIHEADWTHEYLFSPQKSVEKRDIDLLCVSRFANFKNLDVLAKALKIYRKKYPRKIMMTLPCDKPGPEHAHEQEAYEEMIQILGQPEDYVHFVPYIRSKQELAELYSRSKAHVLASLSEGKPRVIHEAMCCDTPVVCFRAFNQYARGQTEIFPQEAGLYAEYFDPECLADTIHTVLENYGDFSPRVSYLKHFGGRKQVFNQCIDSLTYYSNVIPDYQAGRHYDNPWLNQAVLNNYGLSLHDFLYTGIQGVTDVFHCLEEAKEVLEYYTPKVKSLNIQKPESSQTEEEESIGKIKIIDPEWVDWVDENIKRGVLKTELIDIMLENRFDNYATIGLVTRRAIADNLERISLRQDKTYSPVLEIDHPRIVVYENVFTPQECQALIDMAQDRLQPSIAVDDQSGELKQYDCRTSRNTFFKIRENELIATLDDRISEIMQWPVENGEEIQVVNYQVGGEYQPHFDYFNPDEPGSASHIQEQGGQRIATLIVYLNTVELGGETIFPEINLKIKARQGCAVYFSYLDEQGELDPLTLHGGTLVIQGEKWIATKWMRERKYQ